MSENIPELDSDALKPYVKPAIVHDLKLETRAGSTIVGIPKVVDPLGLDPSQNPK